MKLGSPNIAREMTLLDRGHDFTLYDLRQVDQDLTSKEHARISAIRNFFLMSENQFNWWESTEVRIHTWLEVSGGMNFNSKATKTSYPLYIDITSTSMSLSWDCALIHLVMLRLKKKRWWELRIKTFGLLFLSWFEIVGLWTGLIQSRCVPSCNLCKIFSEIPTLKSSHI